LAEQAGFGAIHSSDHFHPWSVRQGQSGFSFSWISAALQSTHLPFSMVCAPGQRYHPAIVAQALATLSEMFPGRIDLELGSGEAINEMITGQSWPSKQLRNDRLLESFQIIRRLLNGEEVTGDGLIKVKNAKLYTLPLELPRLFIAAVSEETSEWGGSWADGLITTGGDRDSTIKKVKSFRQKAGETKPVFIQLSFSYSHTEKEAIHGAWEQWRSNLVDPALLAELSSVDEFDRLSENISKEEVAEKIKIITKADQLLEWINDLKEIHPDRISLHNVNTNQELFIEDLGACLKERTHGTLRNCG
jgi:probable non-F420 flavinoid oxidoreductase